MPSLRVLLLDGDPADLRLVERALHAMRGVTADVRACGAPAEAAEVLAEGPIDVVLSEPELGRAAGLLGEQVGAGPIAAGGGPEPTRPLVLLTRGVAEDDAPLDLRARVIDRVDKAIAMLQHIPVDAADVPVPVDTEVPLDEAPRTGEGE